MAWYSCVTRVQRSSAVPRSLTSKAVVSGRWLERRYREMISSWSQVAIALFSASVGLLSTAGEGRVLVPS